MSSLVLEAFPQDHPPRLGPADVVALRPEQRERAVEGLTESLRDDPLNQHFVPDPAERSRVLPSLMRTFLRYTLCRGLVLTTREIGGASLLLPPAECRLSTPGMLWSGMAGVAWRAGVRAMARFARAGKWLEEFRCHHAGGPHWYVIAQGVVPAHQGRGVGAAVMERTLEIVDQDDGACFAETFTLRNARYYERFGFRITAEAELPGGGPRVWLIGRAARR